MPTPLQTESSELAHRRRERRRQHRPARRQLGEREDRPHPRRASCACCTATREPHRLGRASPHCTTMDNTRLRMVGVWRAEYAFTLGAQFLFNGRRPGVAGQYLDDILLFLEVATLPADFTITATGHFPSTCHMFGSTTPVAGMPFAVDLEVKGFFGQLVSWSRTLSFNLFGDGRAEII